MNNNELYHHGVKGMKWGVRRTPAQLGRASKKSSSNTNRDAVKKMSDTELRQKLNRLNMEKQYLDLTAPKKSAGKKFVTDVLVNAAKGTATAMAGVYIKKGAEYVIKEFSKRVVK